MKIICTLGPSSYNPSVLKKFKKLGVNIFRINLSHTPKGQILNRIKYLKRKNIKNICIDTEGAQIRTTNVEKKIFLKKKRNIKIKISDLKSSKNTINLYPNFNLLSCKIKTQIKVGFNNLVLEVIKKNIDKKYLIGRVKVSGYLESNKAVHFTQNINLPALTEKDKFAIKHAIANGIKYYAMSFVNKKKDVDQMKTLIGKRSFLISKIETKSALKNLSGISSKSNALLIDRGDLSRYVPIEEIPLAQERIIKHSLKRKVPVFVATNLLETMVNEIQPTRAESHDIFSTLRQGASGLVLAAETAIGKNPVECVMFMKKAIKFYKSSKN